MYKWGLSAISVKGSSYEITQDIIDIVFDGVTSFMMLIIRFMFFGVIFALFTIRILCDRLYEAKIGNS
jgi:hypothetical protein